MRWTGDPAAAEDLAQLTLLEAWKSEQTLRDRSARRSWLFGTARSHCLTWSRRVHRKRRAEVPLGDALDDVASPSRTVDFEADLSRGDFALLLDRALHLLPARKRSLVIARCFDHFLIAALPFYVYQRTDSALATAAIIMAKSLPSGLLGSVAGVFVDRWNGKRTLVVTNTLLALTVASHIFIPTAGWLWVAYVSSFCESALGKFSYPAERALLPNLVTQEDLATANSVNGLGDNLARFGGPPFGGILPLVFAAAALYALGGLLAALLPH